MEYYTKIGYSAEYDKTINVLYYPIIASGRFRRRTEDFTEITPCQNVSAHGCMGRVAVITSDVLQAARRNGSLVEQTAAVLSYGKQAGMKLTGIDVGNFPRRPDKNLAARLAEGSLGLFLPEASFLTKGEAPIHYYYDIV